MLVIPDSDVVISEVAAYSPLSTPVPQSRQLISTQSISFPRRAPLDTRIESNSRHSVHNTRTSPSAATAVVTDSSHHRRSLTSPHSSTTLASTALTSSTPKYTFQLNLTPLIHAEEAKQLQQPNQHQREKESERSMPGRILEPSPTHCEPTLRHNDYTDETVEYIPMTLPPSTLIKTTMSPRRNSSNSSTTTESKTRTTEFNTAETAPNTPVLSQLKPKTTEKQSNKCGTGTTVLVSSSLVLMVVLRVALIAFPLDIV